MAVFCFFELPDDARERIFHNWLHVEANINALKTNQTHQMFVFQRESEYVR